MTEIAMGVLLAVAAIVIAAGAFGIGVAPGLDFFPLLGFVGIGLMLAAAGLLMAAGHTRRAMLRHPERRRALRTARMTSIACLLTVALAVGLPLVPGPFNLVRVGGFPGGYYIAAQGALIGLVILVFWWARRVGRIEAEEREA